MNKLDKKVYEVSLHLIIDLGDSGANKVYSDIKKEISSGSSVLSEDAPVLFNLAYPIRHKVRGEGGSYHRYNESYFCSIKFEGSQEYSEKIKKSLQENEDVLRYILFETVAEDTRIKEIPEEESKEEIKN